MAKSEVVVLMVGNGVETECFSSGANGLPEAWNVEIVYTRDALIETPPGLCSLEDDYAPQDQVSEAPWNRKARFYGLCAMAAPGCVWHTVHPSGNDIIRRSSLMASQTHTIVPVMPHLRG